MRHLRKILERLTALEDENKRLRAEVDNLNKIALSHDNRLGTHFDMIATTNERLNTHWKVLMP